MNRKTKRKVIGWVLWLAVVGYFAYGRDIDSTDKSHFTRSGLSLFTDYGTGLQYIRGGFFGDIIPRLDRNGKHYNIYKVMKTSKEAIMYSKPFDIKE